MSNNQNEDEFVIHHEMKKFLILLLYSFIAAVKFTILDMIVKWWVRSMVSQKVGMVMPLTGFLDLVYSWNRGISFSLFADYQYSNEIFIGISVMIIIYIWKLLLDATDYGIYKGYSYIVGGAVGNLIDRIINGAVFDFISFHYKGFYFPAFNLADALITIGAIRVIYGYYRIAKEVAKQKESEYNPISEEAERIRQLDEEMDKRRIKR